MRTERAASASRLRRSDGEIVLRLRQLEELNREGLLSDETYAQKRAELLFPDRPDEQERDDRP